MTISQDINIHLLVLYYLFFLFLFSDNALFVCLFWFPCFLLVGGKTPVFLREQNAAFYA